MSTLLGDAPARPSPRDVPADDRVRPALRVGLLGVGQVGSAVAALAAGATRGPRLTISGALVRDLGRPRPAHASSLPLTTDAGAVLATRPDVLVEVLGGLEPARTLVLDALAEGIPVVTANKSLLAAHGDELAAASRQSGAPLLYEAAVLAGVPFLTMLRRRPRASDVTALAGIVNGTSNYILSRMAADRAPFGQALADAQRAGYAEPDPSKDVDGDDAVEKLCVLLRQFARKSVTPAAVEKTGITGVEPADLQQAAAFGGVLRPIVAADWRDGHLTAHAGPAFVPQSHAFARVDGVQNAVTLRTRTGDLTFSGPGAGPEVTAATVLDDVAEALTWTNDADSDEHGEAQRETGPCAAPATGWFVRLTTSDFPNEQHAPALLGSLGIRTLRVSPLVSRDGALQQWLLTSSCTRPHLDAALDVLDARSPCRAFALRAIE